MNRRKKLEDTLGEIFAKPISKRAELVTQPPAGEDANPPEPPVKTPATVKPRPKRTPAPKKVVEPRKAKQAVPVLPHAETVLETAQPVVEENKEPFPVVPSAAKDAVVVSAASPAASSAPAVALAKIEEVSDKELAVPEDFDKDMHILVFALADTYYGLDVAGVQTIIKPQTIYIVPGTVQFIKGVINLRGNVVPIIDLRNRFELPEVEFTPATRFVVVELGEVMAGLIVDSVLGVEIIQAGMVEPPSRVIMGAHTRFLKGVAQMDGRLVLMLDLEQTLKVSAQEGSFAG